MARFSVLFVVSFRPVDLPLRGNAICPLAAGLIDRFVITRVPVLIGAGIPLFGPLPHDMSLRHVATRSYNCGLVQSEYEIRAGGSSQ